MNALFHKAPFTRYNLLSNRLSNRFNNRFDNRLNVCIHDTTGCQTRLSMVVSYIQPVVKPGCTTWFDNRVERTVCSFNTVVKPVVQLRLTTGCIV